MILSKSPILRASKIFQYFQGSCIFLHPTHPEAWPTWQRANRCLRKYLGSRIGWWDPRYPWSNHTTTEYHRRLTQLLLRFAPMEVSQASPADPLGSLDDGKLFPCLSEVFFWGSWWYEHNRNLCVHFFPRASAWPNTLFLGQTNRCQNVSWRNIPTVKQIIILSETFQLSTIYYLITGANVCECLPHVACLVESKSGSGPTLQSKEGQACLEHFCPALLFLCSSRRR